MQHIRGGGGERLGGTFECLDDTIDLCAVRQLRFPKIDWLWV